MDQTDNQGCSPVLLPNEKDINYVGYKILNPDGSFGNPTNMPQMTLRSKSINNAMNIIQNGNNSNIPVQVQETFSIGSNRSYGSNEYNIWNIMGDIGIEVDNKMETYNEKFLLISFGILFGIIFLWKIYKN